MPNPFLLGVLGASAANAAAAYFLKETLNSTIMRIMIINGYNCPHLTSKIEETARKAASRGTEISVTHSQEGRVMLVQKDYIEENFSIDGILNEYHKKPQMDAYIIASFEDIGVDELRSQTTIPVIGLGEAAFQMASIIAKRFSVIATFPRTVPKIQQNLGRYGVGNKCVKIRAAENSGMDEELLREAVSKEIYRSIKEDQIDAVVLGGIPTTSLIKSLSEEHEIPILDGISSAVKMTEAIVSLCQKSSTSKIVDSSSDSKKFPSAERPASSNENLNTNLNDFLNQSQRKNVPKQENIDVVSKMAEISQKSTQKASTNENLFSMTKNFRKPKLSVSISSLGEPEAVSNWSGLLEDRKFDGFSDTSMVADEFPDLENLNDLKEKSKWLRKFAIATFFFVNGVFGYILWQFKNYHQRKESPVSIPLPLTLLSDTDSLTIILKCFQVDQKTGQHKLIEKKFGVQPKRWSMKNCEEKWSESRILNDKNGDYCRVVMKRFSNRQ